ncbi:MAG: sialidase family protein [Verrucomicrobiales bacterium]
MHRISIVLIALIFAAFAEAQTPPVMLFQNGVTHDPTAPSGSRTSFSIMRIPDGSFAFYNRYAAEKGPVTLPDASGKMHSLLPHLPPEILNSKAILKSDVLSGTQVILTADNAVNRVFVKSEALEKDEAKEVGLPRYLDVWFQESDLKTAQKPKMIWRGYNGSQMEYEQLSNGRILVPYGSFQPHGKGLPPHGRHKTIIQYSDDAGATWQESVSKLISPCYPDFNGSNEGACEPAFEELNNGDLWMTMRTQAGFLYESSSTDHGTTWSPARASQFYTSTGPPNVMRHRNGWLVVCWNNCEMPPREDGVGVYGGRDALHIAVSDDDGKTWRGFREIYLDHRRNDNPEKSGDRGTAYPLSAYDQEGQLVILAGQGKGGRNPILVDPEWVIATERETNFTKNGLENWSVYKHYGPAKRWWRAREVGCALVPNPSDPTKKCLHLRKPDDLPADGATWNFPNGWKGTLTTRLLIREGFQGGVICLNDRFFDPVNDWGEDLAIFRTDLTKDGKIGDVQLKPGEWSEVSFDWDLAAGTCRVTVDDTMACQLPVLNPTLNGLSYLRLRSAAIEKDTAGFLVEKVKVNIGAPHAPQVSATDQAEQEAHYIKNVVPRWKIQK